MQFFRGEKIHVLHIYFCSSIWRVVLDIFVKSYLLLEEYKRKKNIYSWLSLSRTRKGAENLFGIERVRDRERKIGYSLHKGTETLVRDRKRFEIEGVRDRESQLYLLWSSESQDSSLDNENNRNCKKFSCRRKTLMKIKILTKFQVQLTLSISNTLYLEPLSISN